jgi:hypothetical protein
MCFRSVGNSSSVAALSAWAATAMTSCDGLSFEAERDVALQAIREQQVVERLT